MHLFFGHEQLDPPRVCWNINSSWLSGSHLGLVGVGHNELQLGLAVPLTKSQTHLWLQSSVIKVCSIPYVLLAYSHCATKRIIKNDLD